MFRSTTLRKVMVSDSSKIRISLISQLWPAPPKIHWNQGQLDYNLCLFTILFQSVWSRSNMPDRHAIVNTIIHLHCLQKFLVERKANKSCWNAAEVRRLKHGVLKYGTDWSKIISKYKFESKSVTDLCTKWLTITGVNGHG